MRCSVKDGLIIHPYFLLFEVATYVLFALCFWHAAKRSRYRVLELVFAGLYGLLLEWANDQTASGLFLRAVSDYVRRRTADDCAGMGLHHLQQYGVFGSHQTA